MTDEEVLLRLNTVGEWEIYYDMATRRIVVQDPEKSSVWPGRTAYYRWQDDLGSLYDYIAPVPKEVKIGCMLYYRLLNCKFWEQWGGMGE